MRKVLPWLAVFAILALLAMFNAPRTQPARSFAASVSRSTNAPPSIHQVVYKITTSRDWGLCYGFDTTYEMPHGTSQRPVSICDGATSAVVDKRTGSRGDFVYLSAQNDKDSAIIGCEIYIDGELAFQNYSQGQYVITSCSGRID